MADREGFEPSEPLRVHTLSRRARSTTLAPVLYLRAVTMEVIGVTGKCFYKDLTFEHSPPSDGGLGGVGANSNMIWRLVAATSAAATTTTATAAAAE